MVEPDVLTTESQRATWPRNMAGRSFSVPAIYDFDSDEEEDVYPEEVSEVVLPLCARFDSLTREEAGRLLRKENCNGMYLMRNSVNAESGKVLSVWNKGRCRHYRVYYDQHSQTYSLGSNGDNFDNISTVVAYYLFNDLPRSEFALVIPYGRSRQPIRIRRLPIQIKFTANRKQLRKTQLIHVR